MKREMKKTFVDYVIESSRPFMRRYEEARRKEIINKRVVTYCKDTSESLGAPILQDMDFIGLSFEMSPGPDYFPINEDELVMKKLLNCTSIVIPQERLEWELDEVRRHATFHNCHEIVYFPMIYGRHHFESPFVQYLWVLRSSRAKPDEEYILQLRRSIMSAIWRFKRKAQEVTINRLVINDCIYCLNWFNHQTRHYIIKTLAQTFRNQKAVTWISAENTELSLDDGLRLLLAIAVTTGYTLKYLYMWHFFRGGIMPIDDEMTLDIVYIAPSGNLEEKTILKLYQYFVMQANYTIPNNLKTLTLYASLSCLERLKVLSVEYRYLTGGKGKSLVYLGCLKNSTLRELNLMFTDGDAMHDSKHVICASAWKAAFQACPCLRVNFYAFHMSSFHQLTPLFVPYMPLEGLYTTTGLKCDDVPLYLGFLTETVKKHYKRFLKRLNIHLIRPRLRVDFQLSKLLREFPCLEELVYRGPIDQIMTIHTFMDYIVKYNLRLKKIHLYLMDDPCDPEPYRNAMLEICQKYEGLLIDKGVDFKLTTCH